MHRDIIMIWHHYGIAPLCHLGPFIIVGPGNIGSWFFFNSRFLWSGKLKDIKQHRNLFSWPFMSRSGHVAYIMTFSISGARDHRELDFFFSWNDFFLFVGAGIELWINITNFTGVTIPHTGDLQKNWPCRKKSFNFYLMPSGWGIQLW